MAIILLITATAFVGLIVLAGWLAAAGALIAALLMNAIGRAVL